MLTRFKTAGLIWPTLLAIPALAFLLGLGVWQMQRKAWKDGLVAEMKARTVAPPMPLEQVLGALTASYPPDEKLPVGEYTRVLARGAFDHARELYYYAPDQRLGPGYHVYTPLTSPQRDCTRVIIVNRGFVPEPLRAPDKRLPGQIGTAPAGTAGGQCRGRRAAQVRARSRDRSRRPTSRRRTCGSGAICRAWQRWRCRATGAASPRSSSMPKPSRRIPAAGRVGGRRSSTSPTGISNTR